MFAVALLVALAAIVGVNYQQTSLPPPRIVSTRQHTHTQLKKSVGGIATDGSRIYFVEQRSGNRLELAQVSTAGGEATEIPTPFMEALVVGGISPLGSELLVFDCCPRNYWIQPIPAGPPRHAPIPSSVGTAEWALDGNLYYASHNPDELYRVAPDGTNRTRLFTAPAVSGSSLSPDGRHIRYDAMPSAFGRVHPDIMEADMDGSHQHLVLPEMKGQTSLGGWTHDGTLFYFRRDTGNGYIRSLWGIRERSSRFTLSHPGPTLLYAGPLALTAVVASRNSKELYAVGADQHGELSVYDPQSSTFVPYLGGISASYVTFSPDHQWIAYVSYPDGNLWKSRLDGSEKMQLTFPPMGVINPRWSPDGKSIAFNEWFGSEYRAIYNVSADGGQPRLLVTGPSEPGEPAWSPDSRSIVYGGHFTG